VEFTARGHLRQWGLTQLLVFAKHYEEMFIHWDAIGALIEIWHSQTHTFIFPTFEASILIEEAELFLGLKRMKAKRAIAAHSMNYPNATELIMKLTGDWMQTKNIMIPTGIKLSRLAVWIVKAKDQGINDERITRALSLCRAGLIFFPNHDDILDEEHLGLIQSAWQGKSLAQAVLAYLYSGLSLACLGKSFYGSIILLDIWLGFHLKMDFGVNDTDIIAKSYERSPIYKIKDTLHYIDTMVIKTLHVRTRTEWCKFLVRLPCSKFIFSSEVLVELKLKTRLGQGVDLHLVGSKELVLYNAHRCYLQIGQPYHGIPQLSHYPPIELRKFGTYHD